MRTMGDEILILEDGIRLPSPFSTKRAATDDRSDAVQCITTNHTNRTRNQLTYRIATALMYYRPGRESQVAA